MNIDRSCLRVSRIGFYLLLALVPMAFTPINYELFEFNKMILTYLLTVVIVASWMLRMVTKGQIRIPKTPLDVPLLLFLFSQLISTFFSIDGHVSIFGYYSRFNGGLLSTIAYILLYYSFIDTFSQPEPAAQGSSVKKIPEAKSSSVAPAIFRLFTISLVSAVFISLYAVAEHFGIDKSLWVQDVQNRVFSTLGQPNWLAAYLVALIPMALSFSIFAAQTKYQQQTQPIRLLSFGSAVLFFMVLLYTRSRSGLAAFAIADILFLLALWRASVEKTGELRTLVVAFHLIVLGIIFFIGSNVDQIDRLITFRSWQSRLISHKGAPQTTAATSSATLLETGGTESGTIRKYVWQAAVNAWKSSPKAMLIGTGTETFAFAFFRYKPIEHNLTSEWDFLYNKAHNEFLNMLATTGVFGLGSYLLILVVMGVIYIQKFNHVSDQKTKLFIAALASGWTSILISNFFGFSTVVVQLYLYLFPASVLLISQKSITFRYKLIINRQPITQVLCISITLVLISAICIYWYADTVFSSGYRKTRLGQLADAQPLLARAVGLRPDEPLYLDEYSSLQSQLATESDQFQASAAAKLFNDSLKNNGRALTISPNNVNFWKTRTKILYALSVLDPSFNSIAIQALEKAQALSPTDPKISYNLAILHGKQGNNSKAIELLKKTIELKKNYRDAYYALSVFYTEIKKPDLAKQILLEYLSKVDASDKDFLERTN